MQKRKVKPNAVIYSSIIHSLCKDNMVDKAFDLLHEMVEKGIAPNIVTSNCLIHGLCNLGQWKEVARLLTEMQDFHWMFLLLVL